MALLLLAWGGMPDQDAKISRMWKGQDLWAFGGGRYAGKPDEGWQGMAGSTMTLHYSGKGPLPAPKEFVVPLEKPLPLGNYRLFVKNFYLGSMEATLGDITLPLTIRRYDWTPGVTFETNAPVDRITLRYFPSRIIADTGAPQSQNIIVQGVFLTTDVHQVPIRDGEIVTSLPEEKPPAKPGNYLQNGSFECGLYPWGKPFGVGGHVDATNLDPSTAAHGTSSFRHLVQGRFGLETKMVRLPPGTYTLSFHAKADAPLVLDAGVYGPSEDLKGDAGAGLGQRFTLSPQWRRYSVTAELRSLPGLLYTVRFGAASPTPVTLWIDAVQLQNGPMTEFRPAAPVEAGALVSPPGHIFYDGQGAEAELLVFQDSDAAQTDLGYRIIDYWGREVAAGRVSVPLSGRSGKRSLPLFNRRKGIYRLLLSAGPSVSELTYSVLAPNTHLGVKYPQGTLGVDTNAGEKHLAILKRANFNWVNSKFLGRWYLVEPEKGRFVFNDDAVAAFDRSNMMLMIQALNVDWGAQPWLKPLWKPGGGAVWEKRSDFMRSWGDYIEGLVRRFKGSVKTWEIENEPNYVYSAEEYAELLATASERIRRVDPEATIVAFAGGGYRKEYYDKVLKIVRPDAFDRMSVHFYGNELATHTAYAELLRKVGKPGVNSETGTTCPSFFTTLPDYESLRRKDYAELQARDVRRVTAQAVQNYLLTLSAGGMERWFHYFSRDVNSGPAQPTARFGGGKDLTEYDGSLRANAVGLSVASHFVDEARYVGPVDLDPKMQTYLFRKAGDSMGFCWTSAGQPLRLGRLPRGLAFFDILGNPLSGEAVDVSDSVVYFTSGMAPEACAAALKTMSVADAR
jgi:hypothetical protein